MARALQKKKTTGEQQQPKQTTATKLKHHGRLRRLRPGFSASCPSEQQQQKERSSNAASQQQQRRCCGFLSLVTVGAALLLSANKDMFFSPSTWEVLMSSSSSKKFKPTNSTIHINNTNKHLLLVYGHVDMPMMGGTRRNTLLANQFERVCASQGGYSYDAAYQDSPTTSNKNKDHVAQEYPGYNRWHVPLQFMKEIGFENCDYISHALPSSKGSPDTIIPTILQTWDETVQSITTRPEDSQVFLDLHLPCPGSTITAKHNQATAAAPLDPLVDYAMKLCHENATFEEFSCDANWKETLNQRCGMDAIRQYFSSFQQLQQQLETQSRISCFDANDPTYLDYMLQKLQPKRFPIHQMSSQENAVLPNSKITGECARLVRQHLVESFDYFQFCNQCMDSPQQLNLLAGNSANDSNYDNSLRIQPPDNVIPQQLFVSNDSKIPIVYGHLHMPKTAGTSVNGILSSRFERVCGNKGYSYDAIQFTKAFANVPLEIRKNTSYHDLTRRGSLWRGRLSPKTMNHIGYRDCDYISREVGSGTWKELVKRTYYYDDEITTNNNSSSQEDKNDDDDDDDSKDEEEPTRSLTQKRQQEQQVQFEVHVPCRDDPLDHAMSLCNHYKFQFPCNESTWKQDLAKECRLDGHIGPRFSKRLLNTRVISRVQCFRSIPLEPYLNYMEQRLQPRRMTVDYVQRETNAKRDKAQECIFWQNNTQFASRVRGHLLKKYTYFHYCKKCMGSKDELQLS